MAFDKDGFSEWLLKSTGTGADVDAYPVMLEGLEKKYHWDIDSFTQSDFEAANDTLTKAIEDARRNHIDKKYVNTHFETPRSALRRYKVYLSNRPL